MTTAYDAFGVRVCDVLDLDLERVRAVRIDHQAGDLPFATVELRVTPDELARIIGDDNPTGKPERVPR